jgi:methionyl aminopeptidase
MIVTKTDEQLGIIRESGAILRDVHKMVEDNIGEGMTTLELDELCRNYIIKRGASPSFLNYNGYPSSICASIDEEVVHGIPDNRRLKRGMIVGVDIGVYYKGLHTDAARTYIISDASPLKRKLVVITKESFFKGIEGLKAGVRLGDLGHKIQSHVEANGMSVVRALVGHGVGLNLHEDPSIPNFGTPGHGLRLKAGMTVAIEPMVNLGTYDVEVKTNGWTVVTKDLMPSAHYENTLIILTDGVEIITM